jgi:hypothetical protein
MVGCWSRPACGKYCKLVCETKKIPAVGYGYKCETICIPCPSKPGCKHCYSTCCGDTEIEGCRPKIEFCWKDWFACGCAKPRSVKVLAKYQAEKEVCWYHWEVVDPCAEAEEPADDSSYDANLNHPHVYKAAPADAQPGDVLPITDDERTTLAGCLPVEQRTKAIQFTGGEEVPTQSRDSAEARPSAADAFTDSNSTSVKQSLIEFLNR